MLFRCLTADVRDCSDILIKPLSDKFSVLREKLWVQQLFEFYIEPNIDGDPLYAYIYVGMDYQENKPTYIKVPMKVYKSLKGKMEYRVRLGLRQALQLKSSEVNWKKEGF